MDKNKNLILNALDYFDKNNDKYEKFIDKVKYVTFELADNEYDHDIMIFYDKNKKEFFRSRYELIGIYLTKLMLWVWSWSLYTRTKNNISLSKKLLNYGLDLDPELEFLKREFINSRFIVNDQIQLDIHIAIASYITKVPFIYKFDKTDYDKQTNMYEIAGKTKDFSLIIEYLYLLDEYE